LGVVAPTTLVGYVDAVSAIHAVLPSVLSRTQAETTYGREAEVRERVQRTLVDKYGLSQELIENNPVRVLRGFVQDISTQPDRWFNATEFDFELRTAWPRMNMVSEPPAHEATDIERRTILETVLSRLELGRLMSPGPPVRARPSWPERLLGNSRSASPTDLPSTLRSVEMLASVTCLPEWHSPYGGSATTRLSRRSRGSR